MFLQGVYKKSPFISLMDDCLVWIIETYTLCQKGKLLCGQTTVYNICIKLFIDITNVWMGALFIFPTKQFRSAKEINWTNL